MVGMEIKVLYSTFPDLPDANILRVRVIMGFQLDINALRIAWLRHAADNLKLHISQYVIQYGFPRGHAGAAQYINLFEQKRMAFVGVDIEVSQHPLSAELI